MAVIAITGASGFIGRELVARARTAGHEILTPDRRLLTNADPHLLERADAVVHLAGRAHVLNERHADPASAFFEANVQLTQRVFAAALAAGVRRFVHVSSAGVLGTASPVEGFTDDSPAAPREEYARSKLQAEEWLRSQSSSGLEIVVIRPPLVHGPGARGNFGRVMKISRWRWPLPFGALRATRSLIGLRNLCDLLLTTVTAPRVPRAPMLVSDGEDTSFRDLIVQLRHARGRPAGLIPVPAAVFSTLLRLMGRASEVPKLTQPFVLRPRIAAEEMGWQPPYSLREELEWAVSAEEGAHS